MKARKPRARSAAGPPRLPRVPLPRQTGGAHEDKTRRPPRRMKHRRPPGDDDG